MLDRKSILYYRGTKNFIYLLLAFFVIYSTDSLLIELSLIDPLRDAAYLSIISLGALFLISFLLKHKGKLKRKSDCWIVVLIISIALSTMFNFDLTFVGPIKAGCLLIGFYIANEMDTNLFIEKYVKIMIVISFFSLITFLFRPVILTFDFLPTLTGYKGQIFQLFFLSNTRIYPSTYRNWGPFWEPGAYQTYLIIALLFVLFDRTNMKRRKVAIAILSLTLVSTFSTTGYIAFPFIFAAYILDTNRIDKHIIWKLLLVFIVALVAIWFLSSDYYTLVFEQKFDDDVINHRALTIEHGLKLMLQKPIFGFSSKYTEAFYQSAGFQFGITNFFVANAVCFGIIVGVYSIWGIIVFVRSLNRAKLISLLILMGLVLSLCGEKYLYSPMICFLLFYRKSK